MGGLNSLKGGIPELENLTKKIISKQSEDLKKHIINDNSDQTKKILLNKQIEEFRGIGKDGNLGYNSSFLDLEDPTFLIFEINVDDSEKSPLFGGSELFNFLKKYGQNDYEIHDAHLLFNIFHEKFLSVFPAISSSNKQNFIGDKRHYISSIQGLEVLNKTIINYPEDKIVIKLTEDITMLMQYISELYLNLHYSFATNRQLIPSNLLKFDMYITITDVRDMKNGIILNKDGSKVDKLSENKSKFIYKLHDCELNFFESKNHKGEITVGGYDSGPTTTPSTLEVSINFKSYSRILSTALLKDSYLLDYRLKDEFKIGDVISNHDGKHILKNNDESYYTKYNNDNKHQFEYERNAKKYYSNGVDLTKTNKVDNFLNKLSKEGKKQIGLLGSSLTAKLKNETNILVENIQKGISDAVGFNLTLNKINVYYETPFEKMERMNLLASNLVDKLANKMQKSVRGGFKDVGDKIGLGGKSENANRTKNVDLGSFGKSLVNGGLNDLNSLASGRSIKRGQNYSLGNNIYDINFDNKINSIDGIINRDNVNMTPNGNVDTELVGKGVHYNKKYPSLDNSYPVDPKHPNDSYLNNLYEDGTYTKKKIIDALGKSGVTYFDHYNVNSKSKDKGDHSDRLPDGVYNEKYPNKEGDKNHLTTTNLYNNTTISNIPGKILGNVDIDHYNQKFPTGDLNENGVYNEKYPDGSVSEKGDYNEKYPKGDLNENGVYNEKFPDGSVSDKGSYNEKYPSGDLMEKGKYNEKYPSGDLMEKGTYNEKFPDGKVSENGTYNEKYPKGDLNEKGTYNQKFPTGDLQEKGKYNEKFPKGDLNQKSTYNEKFPTGDLQEKGKYNEKYPDGGFNQKNTYNQKFPDGNLSEKGKYNEKHPNGNIQSPSTYNEKYPNGRLNEKGTYNEKYPKGDLNEKGQYNLKFPDGSVSEKGTYNEKYPIGDLEKDGQYNIKFPDDINLYKNDNNL